MTPANTPQSQPAPLVALKQRYQTLQAVGKAAKEKLPQLVQTGNIEAVRELRDTLRAALKSFKEELARDPVELEDGRTILRHEHEGLRIFAQKNGRTIDEALGKITITNNSVTAADFNNQNITTLEGLKFLRGLKALDISQNNGLTSLEGIPSQVEVLDASLCGLTLDLKAIAALGGLRELNVSCNKGLTSLKGIPSQVEVLNAERCGFTGDLKAIAALIRLKELNISGNRDVTSLAGIPSQVQVLNAWQCGLTGDLKALSALTKLKELNVAQNSGLTSLDGVPSQVEKLEAWLCGLNQLKALAALRGLKKINITGNSGLKSLDGIPSQVEVLYAGDCGFTGDREAVKAILECLHSSGVLKEVYI